LYTSANTKRMGKKELRNAGGQTLRSSGRKRTKREVFSPGEPDKKSNESPKCLLEKRNGTRVSPKKKALHVGKTKQILAKGKRAELAADAMARDRKKAESARAKEKKQRAKSKEANRVWAGISRQIAKKKANTDRARREGAGAPAAPADDDKATIIEGGG
jgi:hypothetical protein